MAETRTLHDPFLGKTVHISDRLRGQYASGPHLPNGKPEFGWRQFQAPPIQHEAAARIEALEAALHRINSLIDSPAHFNGDIQAVLDGVIDTSDTNFQNASSQ